MPLKKRRTKRRNAITGPKTGPRITQSAAGTEVTGADVQDLLTRGLTTQLSDEQWLREMRLVVRTISLQLSELELIFRAMEVLESKQAVRSWFNSVVPALGARPIDLCKTARGRRAILQELGRLEHGVHS